MPTPTAPDAPFPVAFFDATGVAGIKKPEPAPTVPQRIGRIITSLFTGPAPIILILIIQGLILAYLAGINSDIQRDQETLYRKLHEISRQIDDQPIHVVGSDYEYWTWGDDAR